MPYLSEKTLNGLRSVIRGEGTILRNPFDLGMAIRFPDVLGKALKIIDDDSNADFIMVNERIDFLLLFNSLNEINTLNDVLIDFNATGHKPLIVISTQASADVERIAAEKRLSEAHIPVYPSFQRAAKAIANVIKYRGNL